eukprot:scaffold1237_cov243-Pinguiococcus_pyrenoidosus.AAC.41
MLSQQIAGAFSATHLQIPRHDAREISIGSARHHARDDHLRASASQHVRDARRLDLLRAVTDGHEHLERRGEATQDQQAKSSKYSGGERKTEIGASPATPHLERLRVGGHSTPQQPRSATLERKEPSRSPHEGRDGGRGERQQTGATNPHVDPKDIFGVKWREAIWRGQTDVSTCLSARFDEVRTRRPILGAGDLTAKPPLANERSCSGHELSSNETLKDPRRHCSSGPLISTPPEFNFVWRLATLSGTPELLETLWTQLRTLWRAVRLPAARTAAETRTPGTAG